MSAIRPQASGSVQDELPFAAERVAESLLDWYRCAGRDLPWRQTRDPYRIWLSEIMLQQTTVAAVIGYYRRFLAHFPQINDLAAAPLEEVIDLWAGLGYYARARNLHATAQQVSRTGGEFPLSVADLMQLPGIGRSTAGAIAALAFDLSAPILDGNVRRILCRLLALQQPPRSSAAEKLLWSWAERLTPEMRVHDYTQAIMDLGACLCTPRNPRCADCPLASLCEARRLGLVDQLPQKMPKKSIPLRRELALLLVAAGKCLVQRRPATGLLGGLYEFPSLVAPLSNPDAAIGVYCAGRYAVKGADKPCLLGQAHHAYSHFKLEVAFYRVELEPCAGVAETADQWFSLDKLPEIALHGAHKKLLPLIAAAP